MTSDSSSAWSDPARRKPGPPTRPSRPRTRKHAMTSPPDNSTGSPGPGRVLLALARDLTSRAQAARAAAEPVTGPELGAWLRAQREARTWTQDEMARRITAAARAAGDTSLP